MKTVIDAVNEYEGLTPKPCHAENKEQIIMAKKPFDGYLTGDLTTGDGVRDNKYWKVICTREEFNQCVDEMATNFGRSSFKHLAIWQGELNKPVTAPTYTQEMFDNGELPPIGSRFIDTELGCDGDTVVIALTYDLGGVVYRSGDTESDSEYFRVMLPDCRPLAPTVELIDGKAYQFDYNGVTSIGICYTSIKNKITHTMFESPVMDAKTNSEFCTNIKLLGVIS